MQILCTCASIHLALASKIPLGLNKTNAIKYVLILLVKLLDKWKRGNKYLCITSLSTTSVNRVQFYCPSHTFPANIYCTIFQISSSCGNSELYLDLISDPTTWYKRTFFKISGLAIRSSLVFSSILSNASLVGANTVNGPSPERVSVNSALAINSTKVEAPSRVNISGNVWAEVTWKKIWYKHTYFLKYLCC